MEIERKEPVQVFELGNSESFVPVQLQEDGKIVTFYGGDQQWYKTRVGRYSGCGAVAAADIFAYLALRNPGLESLFNRAYPEITVESFLAHMDAVIHYVSPLHIPGIDVPYGGLTSLPRFTKNCEDFAASRGVAMVGRHLSGQDIDMDKAAGIIGGQLSVDNPVALLIMQNKKLKHIEYTDPRGKPAVSDMRFHWVVITAMRRQAGKTLITVSSEGACAEMDFDDVWNGAGDVLFGTHGIVYFTVDHS
jgi:hypothetical protein